MAVIMGFVLRIRHAENLAVEHFDEGVYSAGIWYHSPDGQPYPASHLYAPPLLPTIIDCIAMVPGTEKAGPFLPSMILGSLTVLVVWWFARSCFGMNAGLFAVFILAFSDYHIVYSRMVLTDVPVLFWMVLAVSLALHGIHRASYRLMFAAGIMTGLAWWTKYLGWLPLAIVGSGSLFWWALNGRRILPLTNLLKLLAIMTVTAVVLWLPWLWVLQDYGGYAAVRANHQAYYTGFDNWQDHMASHIMYQFTFDSWVGAVAIGLGMLAAGTRRWIELARSPPNTTGQLSADAKRFPAPTVLARFILAGVLMTVLATGISSIGMLICIGVGGLAGMFLWPTVSELHRRAQAADLSPDPVGGAGYRSADLSAAAQIDPKLASCVVVSWFLGMVLTTPTYTPFPRLSLPLWMAVWLAASAGVGWWIEATINVARRGNAVQESGKMQFLKRMVSGMALAALAITLMSTGGLQAPRIWQDRTSLQNATYHVAETVVQDSAGTFVRETVEELPVDSNGIISPDPVEGDGSTISTGERLRSMLELPFEKPLPLADLENPECVVYAYGEPAVLFHLSTAGITAGPVASIPYPAGTKNKTYPTYFVWGPNALRTPGFLNDWARQQERFELVKVFYYAPSEPTLLNWFTPEWIGQHLESRVQKLELYRLQ